MPSDHTRQLVDLVGEAMALPREARAGFLLANCADAAIRAEAASLIASLDQAHNFMERPTLAQPQRSGLNPASDPLSGIAPGTVITRYRISEQIGEGGFGAVYRARQLEPVQRDVALKIIKLGMDTREVIARFEAERHALALMDHPGIATVLDAGTTDSGRPFFVMELVRGEPITRFATDHALSTRRRVELFSDVCRAVQHAHTKGIIHRDLKPGNVLVSVVDGRPVPKVIDFGIAKAAATARPDGPQLTEARQLLGTPEYLSPEQADGAALDVDARADIYSLGVLLYELLTGVTPFDAMGLRSTTWHEMQRIIREVEPPRPSTRIRAFNDSRPPAARIPASQICGDLDWIVMRCLEKDRARRYSTADALAADLQRHLSGKPVEAAPPSALYRTGKFIARHTVVVSAAACVVIALLVGLGGALWQANIAARERDAQKRAAAAAQAARDETAQIAQFQSAQLRGIDAQQMGERLRRDLLDDVRARLTGTGKSEDEVLAAQAQLSESLDQSNLTSAALKSLDHTIFQRTLAAINVEFRDRPLVRASLLQTLADTMAEVGLIDAALAPQADALALRRTVLGNDHPDTLHSMNQFGELSAARGELEAAESLLREAYQGAAARFGPESREALGPMSSYAVILQMRGRAAEAEPLRHACLQSARRLLGPDDPDTLQYMNNMAGLLFEEGRLDEAEPLFRETLQRRRAVLGADHLDTLQSMNNLATLLEARSLLSDAEPLYRDALELSRRARGEDHPDTLLYLGNLGHVLVLQNRLDEAEPFTREALDRRRRILRNDHWETLQSMHNLATLYRAQNKPALAETLYREAFEGRRTTLGAHQSASLQSLAGLAATLAALDRYTEAEQLLLSTVAAPDLNASPKTRAQCAQLLARLYESWDALAPDQGHAVEAARWKAKALPGPNPATPGSHP